MPPIVQRTLLIAYAKNEDTQRTVSAAEIAHLLQDARDQTRLRSTALHDTRERKRTPFTCPACFQLVYPHAPRVKPGGRYFWSHKAGGARFCPLERKRSFTPDDIGRSIFQGRQEGQAHKDLVAQLKRMAEHDPGVQPESIEEGEYEPPASENRSEFPHGRFPDLKFSFRGRRIVIEAQLAAIALDAINGRRAFYDRNGQCLLWVTRGMSKEIMQGIMRAYLRDLLADQKGVLFSVDPEICALSEHDNLFRLHAWDYDFTSSDGETWRDQILTLDEVLAHPAVLPWHLDFKERWASTFAHDRYRHVTYNQQQTLCRELEERCGIREPIDTELLRVLNLLICLETSNVLWSGHDKLISLVHSTLDGEARQPAARLINRALLHWHPSLADEPKVARKIRSLCSSVLQWRRKTPLGVIRDKLFPEWELPKPSG